jgi:SOS-response transcriptional repressor LexA
LSLTQSPPGQLTERQAEILAWMIESHRKRGHPATLREMCEAFGFSGTNAAVSHMRPLFAKGYVRNQYGTTRSWIATRDTDGCPIRWAFIREETQP